MQESTLAKNAEDERNELRALIERQTKEFESKHGAVQTQEIIRKDINGGEWNGAQLKKRRPSAAQIEFDAVLTLRYPEAESLASLAKELGVNKETLRARASRAGVKRTIRHHNAARADERMHAVEKFLDAGEPANKIAEKMQIPERSVRYYRQRLKNINKDADAVELRIDAIEKRSK